MNAYLSTEGERIHASKVLKKINYALSQEDSLSLKQLSNYTIHSASAHQDDRSILIAVITYTLSKVIERKDSLDIVNWKALSKKVKVNLISATKHLEKGEEQTCIKHLKEARKTLTSASPKLKEYIKEVIRKASINKASRIYEHGISMERTADLLGVSIWELSEYIGQTPISETKQNITVDVRERIKYALNFFEK